MDYLASKKVHVMFHTTFPDISTYIIRIHLTRQQVLHGDLAARNVLLADDGVAKVADFGMAKKMYYEGKYEKTGQVCLNNVLKKFDTQI
jgi:tRNA A-37 threonylcarbamoyl transferase component Bud32